MDLIAFSSSDYKADSYLFSILSQRSEAEVKDFRLGLQKAKDAAAGDLQRNVHKNYTEFVTISKEISSLEGDLLVLRDLINDLIVVNENLRPVNEGVKKAEDNDGSLSAPNREPQLAAKDTHDPHHHGESEKITPTMKAAIQSLYDTVEGLQRVLPPSKDRYIVRGPLESFQEVQGSNYKQKQSVTVYLLNDHLLSLVKKKNLVSGKGKLMVARCLRINEMAVLDMKETSELNNAFKIVSHPDVFIYRSDSPEEKRSLLASIKRLTENLNWKRKTKIDSGEGHEQADIQMAAITAGKTEETINEGHQEKRSSKSNLKPNIFNIENKWLIDLPDELDVMLAHREFDDAVLAIERAKKLLNEVEVTHITQLLRQAIEKRMMQLSHLISEELANPIITKSQAQSSIQRLLNLGLNNQ
ncbi:exocyst complex component exo84, partial [Chytridiales sp. JEL 0842]